MGQKMYSLRDALDMSQKVYTSVVHDLIGEYVEHYLSKKAKYNNLPKGLRGFVLDLTKQKAITDIESELDVSLREFESSVMSRYPGMDMYLRCIDESEMLEGLVSFKIRIENDLREYIAIMESDDWNPPC